MERFFQGVEGEGLQVILSLILSLPFVFLFLHNLCVLLLFWVSLVLCFVLFNMFLFCLFSVLFFFFSYKNLKKNWKIKKIHKRCLFVYIGTCVPWMAIETTFSKLYISCSLDEHLYTQLSKWALWLVFVMSKIKSYLVLNTRITIFDGKD